MIVFYALQFPHARLGVMWRIFFLFRWVRFPAWVALVVWLLLQTLTAVSQLAGFSNVSAMAHFGGAAVGLAAWLVWRRGTFRAAPTTGDDKFQHITDTFARLRRFE